MNRKSWWLVVGVAMAVTGVAVAQQKDAKPAAKDAPCSCPMHGGDGMPGGHMMGGHMMGGRMGPGGPGMMGPGMPPPGEGPMHRGPMMEMLSPDTKVDVKKDAKGVTITITSDDPKTASRIQKMAEIMRLQHELRRDAAP